MIYYLLIFNYKKQNHKTLSTTSYNKALQIIEALNKKDKFTLNTFSWRGRINKYKSIDKNE